MPDNKKKNIKKKPAICGFYFVLLLAGFTSCTQFWFEGIQKEADEMEILFYVREKGSTNPAPVVLHGRNPVDKISSFISAIEPTATDCGYDGVLKYMHNGKVLLDVEFALADSCSYVAFVLNNKINYRKLTPEGIAYLRHLNN